MVQPPAIEGAEQEYSLNHACRLGAYNVDYEVSLGGYWEAGFARLHQALD